MRDKYINQLFNNLKAQGIKLSAIWEELYLKKATIVQVNRLILKEHIGK